MFAGTKVACHPYALKGNGFEGHTQCFLLPLQDVGSNAAAAHDDVLRDPLTCSSCSAAACAECSRASSRTPSGVVHTWTCPFCQNSNQLPVLMGDPFAQDDPAALFPELQKNNIEFGNSLLTLAEHQVSGRGPLVVFVVDECFSGCDLSVCVILIHIDVAVNLTCKVARRYNRELSQPVSSWFKGGLDQLWRPCLGVLFAIFGRWDRCSCLV